MALKCGSRKRPRRRASLVVAFACILFTATTKSGRGVVQPFRLDGRRQRLVPLPRLCSPSKRRSLRQDCRPTAGSRGATQHCHSLPHATLDPFEECWSTTSQDANPNGSPQIDRILQSLHSPAPQSYYVIRRAIDFALDPALTGNDTRGAGDLATIERELSRCAYLLKPGRRFLVRNGPLLAVEVAESSTSSREGKALLSWCAGRVLDRVPDGWSAVADGSRGDGLVSVVALASEALDLVLDASERMENVDPMELGRIVSAIRTRLRFTLGTDVRGRASSDAAFALSLAGVTDGDLYDALLHVSVLEMRRLGRRPSKAAKDYLHIVEKVAASGALRGRNERLQELYALAAQGLAAKGGVFQPLVQILSTENATFDLFSHRPMLWLWRYSSRLTKPQIYLQTCESPESNGASPKFDWGGVFRNSSLPLVVDLGCGLGTSLLGLASTSESERRLGSLVGDFDLSTCNFVGGDLSTASLRFGSGIAKRWNLTDKVSFMLLSAQSLLDLVLNGYDGRVALVMIQFPTPYRLANLSGNAQLPAGIDDGFMVTKSVMRTIADVLRKSKGYLMIQTNCEDVALALRDRALEHGLTTSIAEEPDRLATQTPEPNMRLPERTIEWIRLGGDRATGPEWWRTPVLPPRCATETEVACLLQGTPIHRCLMRGPL